MHPNEENLLLVKNGDSEVGVLPQYGGHVVLLRTHGGPNVLKSDPGLWIPPCKGRVDFTSGYHFKPINGHIVWLGPQDEWWLHQETDQERKLKRAPWPPDPFLTAAAYRVVSQDAASVVMESPTSPYTGIQLTKRVSTAPDGGVSFSVTATNIRDVPVSWDLWLNTRMDGFDRCYVPVDGASSIRLQSPSRPTVEAMTTMVANGMFTFMPQPPSHGMKMRTTKAFIDPVDGFIAGFRGGQILLVSFLLQDRARIHERQAQVEIFNCTTPDGSADLLELEYHAPYVTLGPGESMSAEERWTLHAYDGGGEPESHISFLYSMPALAGNPLRTALNPESEVV